MATPAQDRLAALFKAVPLPTPPAANVKTYAEKELEVQTAGQSSWKIPDQAEYPRKHSGPAPKPADNTDLLTSSEDDDDDDYVAAFSEKPKMRPAEYTKSGRRAEKSKASSQGRRKNAQSFKTDEHLRGDLPVADKHGNPVIGHFCSFNLVAKFPYKYMNDGNGRVSRHFFANGKIFARTWDLYYLHGPETSLLQPLILVPYEQVKLLIHEIATTFKAEVVVPSSPFTLTFFNDRTPQPQFLGTCNCRADINDKQDSIPAAPPGHGEPPANATMQIQSSYAAFRVKFERAQAATKRKSAAAAKKKAADRTVQILASCRSLTRAQKYLGLRPAPAKLAEPDMSMSWDEQAAFYAQQDSQASVKLDPLDVSKPAPFPFDQFPVLVCPDIESYERAHDIITEVGISTLDTLDLSDLAPGHNGENWRKHIRSRHFRILENTAYRNKDFCIGDPDAFQFGDSEFVSIEDIGEKIDSCFQWPFSAQYKHDCSPKFKDWNTLTAKLDSATLHDSDNNSALLQKGPKERTILIVGHDIKSDLAYLSKLNSSIFASKPAPTVLAAAHPVEEQLDTSSLDDQAARAAKTLQAIKEALDTAALYKVLMKDQNTRSLSGLLYDLEIPGFYLHNGGNDARYTLEALVAMTIKARKMDDEESAAQAPQVSAVTKEWNESSGWDTEKERRMSNKLEQARREVEEGCNAWDIAFAEDRAKANESMEPFLKTPSSTHAALEKQQQRKTSTQKGQEREMELRENHGVDGPCDWAIGGKDGCA